MYFVLCCRGAEEEKIEIFVLVFYLCGILDTVLALKTRHNIVQEVEDKISCLCVEESERMSRLFIRNSIVFFPEEIMVR